MKFIFTLLSFCYIFCFSFEAKADVVGSEVTYACTATPGIYEITLVFYKDCSAISAPLCPGSCGSACQFTMQIERADSGFANTIFGSVTMSLQSVRDVDIRSYCPTSKNMCTNRGCAIAGSYGPSFERYEFKGFVNIGPTSGIPANCCNVRISHNGTHRIGSIGTINDPVSSFIYNYAMINRCLSVSPCNSSPEFKRDPIMAINGGDHFLFNNAAIDPNYDSLSYHFAPAINATYLSPFSYLNPLPWVSTIPNANSCDALNGDIRFHPPRISSSFNTVVVVEIKQWKNINGVPNLLGIIRRETNMLIKGETFPNNRPFLSTNPTAYPNTAIPKFNWAVCEDEQLCFTVTARDSDIFTGSPSSDTTFLNWDTALASRGATFIRDYDTLSGIRPVEDRYRFCWTPPVGTASNTPYYFTVAARNRNCPEPGRASQGFSITVSAKPLLQINQFPSSCNKVLLGYTNLTPNAPLYSTVWRIAKASNDPTFSNGYSQMPATSAPKSILFKQAGRYYIQLIAASSPTNNSAGCTAVFTDYIDAVGTSLRDSVTANHILCYGLLHGSFTLNGQNGVAPYLYRIDTQAYSNIRVYNNMAAGQYIAWVKDINNCEVPDTIIIKEPAAIFTGKTPIAPICRDSNNARLLVRTIGGNPPYQYQLNNQPFQTDTFFLNLSPGRYPITTTDSTGCFFKDSVTIPNTPNIRSTFTVKHLACHNDSNATISASGVFGKSPFVYALNNQPFQTDSIFSNLPAGSYQITTRDDNQCLISDSFHLQNPKPIGATYIIVQPRCFGEFDGGLTITSINGNAPYRYRLNNLPLQSSPNFNGLLSTKYFVSIVDSGNCSFSDSIFIPQPSLLSYSKSKTNPTCHNVNNGSMVFQINGGTTPYRILFDSVLFVSQLTINNLKAGAHSYQIKDYKNCTISGIDTLVNPEPLVAGSISGDSTSLVNHTNTYTARTQTGVFYFWTVGGGTITSRANTSSATIKWDSIGMHTVQLIVTKNSTCSDTARFKVNIGTVGINEIARTLGLTVYPNPTKNILNINVQQLPEHTQIQLFDVQGKLLLQQDLKLTQQLDIETLAAGLYLLKIGSWSGQVVKE